MAQCPTYLGLKRAIPPPSARELDQVGCSVLLAWSTKDRVLPFKRYGRTYREALPFAELRMLPDVGHVPMMDDPAGIATLIRDFVTRPATPGAFTRRCRRTQRPVKLQDGRACVTSSADAR